MEQRELALIQQLKNTQVRPYLSPFIVLTSKAALVHVVLGILLTICFSSYRQTSQLGSPGGVKSYLA